MRTIIVLLIFVAAVSLAQTASSDCAKLCLIQVLKKQASAASCFRNCVKDVKHANALLNDESLSDLRATTGLNIRAGPCTDKKIVASVATGATLTFAGETKSGCGYVCN